MNRLSNDEIERLAHKRAGAKLGWYFHFAVYVVVNTFLFALSYFGLRERAWSMYPVLGWGLGVALHGLSVFLIGQGGGIREKMVQQERERLQRQRSGGQ
ncbi:2TM domain-containing protein [Caenimonas koreensis]|nr:2TM domain-containing protein [Caenimonas koreensis]